MSYHVYFGDAAIYGAEAVDVALARPVTVYNGIGSGEFPVPEDQKLREWTVKGQWTEQNDYRLDGWRAAHRLLSSLRGMLGSDEPERLIIANGWDKTSVLAYLTDVTMAEKYAGVYSFTLKATEYKKTTVRTTGVPAITRPGKIPEMPKTVVFDSAGAVATDAVKRTIAMNAVAGALSHQAGTDTRAMSSAMATGALVYRWTDSDGRVQTTTNPNLVPKGKQVKVETVQDRINDTPGALGAVAQDFYDYSQGFGPAIQSDIEGAKKAFSAIGQAYDDFKKWRNETFDTK